MITNFTTSSDTWTLAAINYIRPQNVSKPMWKALAILAALSDMTQGDRLDGERRRIHGQERTGLSRESDVQAC